MQTQDQAYDPEQLESFFDSYDKAIAAADYAEDLKAKADRTAVKVRDRRSKVQALISEVNRQLWQEGIAPDPEKCVSLYDERKALTSQINIALKVAKCDAQTRRTYLEAAKLYHEDARSIREEMRGSPIKASKKLDPKMLQRIIVKQAEARKS